MNMAEIQAPHCDQDILHAPGECNYCDKHPDWQTARKVWGIAFTGHEPTVGQYGRAEIACPSDTRRPGHVADRWPGNQAQ